MVRKIIFILHLSTVFYKYLTGTCLFHCTGVVKVKKRTQHLHIISMCKYVHNNLVQEWKLIMETNSSLKLWWIWIEVSSGHRNEHSLLTVIMSSRAFSTFSLAWFIMLDLWLWRVLIIPINSFYQRYSSSKIPAWTKYDFILNFLELSFSLLHSCWPRID